MNDFFNPNNILMRGLSKISDLIALNFIFLITSLPIFTLGASLSAISAVNLRLISNKEGYIIKGYLKEFKTNFKQATKIWIPVMFLLIFFIYDLYVVFNIIDESFHMLQIPIWIMLFMLISIIIYVFPIISRYDTSTKAAVKNSLILSLTNIPVTISIIAIFIGIVYMASLSSYNLIMVFSICIFVGLSLFSYICCIFLTKIFKKFDPADEEEDEDQSYTA